MVAPRTLGTPSIIG